MPVKPPFPKDLQVREVGNTVVFTPARVYYNYMADRAAWEGKLIAAPIWQEEDE